MAYTETTHSSWGERLRGAVVGVVAGIVMFLVGSWLLYANEGRTVKQGGAIKQAQAVAVEATSIAQADPALEGKVVHATGRAETTDIVRDPDFGVEATAIAVERKVEYYQWVEKSHEETRKRLGGGTETVTTYTYREEWTNQPINSTEFHDPQYRERNRVLAELPDWKGFAPKVAFGAYQLADFQKQSVGGAIDLPVTLTAEQRQQLGKRLNTKGYLAAPERPARTNAEKMLPSAMRADDDAPPDASRLVHANGNVVYFGSEPSQPRNADVRITFRQVPPAVISVVAQVEGNTFVPFRSSTGYTFSRLAMGEVSRDDMFSAAATENSRIGWLLRGLGALLVILGLGAVLRPLSVLADVLPFIGNLVGLGTNLVAGVVGVSWSLLVIAIAWLRFRPLLAVVLIAVAAALAWYLRQRGRQARAD